MILVNALGCTVTGARGVARELLRSYNGEERVVAVVADHGRDFQVGRRVRLVPLSHRWFGRFLRPLYEVAINVLLLCGVFSRCINLSHYGLCWFGTHHLYIHSPEIVSDDPARGFSDGRVNVFKSYFFGTCLRRAARLYVQTSHMREKVVRLLRARGLAPGRVELVRPLVEGPDNPRSSPKSFVFQAFYPSSPFRHKRPDLAVDGVSIEVRRGDRELGLVITIERSGDDGPHVQAIGRVDHERALAIMHASDFLLFTSEQETLGLPLIEAMHAGLPAVLPDADYATELYGDAAVYYAEPTPESVAEAIARLRANYPTYRSRVPGRLASVISSSCSWSEHWARFLS